MAKGRMLIDTLREVCAVTDDRRIETTDVEQHSQTLHATTVCTVSDYYY